MRIDPARAALLVIDVQERLWAVMAAEERAAVARNILILGELARRRGMPIVVSEQYSRGLGPTLAELAPLLEGARRFEKMAFSAASAPAFAPVAAELEGLGRDTWVVCGMETHICVYLTARDLRARGRQVHVVADAVISRTRENRALGLELARTAGAFIMPTETVVFDVLGAAGSDDFRALSKLVK